MSLASYDGNITIHWRHSALQQQAIAADEWMNKMSQAPEVGQAAQAFAPLVQRAGEQIQQTSVKQIKAFRKWIDAYLKYVEESANDEQSE